MRAASTPPQIRKRTQQRGAQQGQRSRFRNGIVGLDAAETIVVRIGIGNQVVKTRTDRRGRCCTVQTASELKPPIERLRFEKEHIHRVKAGRRELHGQRRAAEAMNAIVAQNPRALNVQRTPVVGGQGESPYLIGALHPKETRKRITVFSTSSGSTLVLSSVACAVASSTVP